MENLLLSLPENDLAPVLVVMSALIAGVLVITTTVISVNARKLKERQLVASLIKDMLDRGMPTEEICQVMASAGGSRSAMVQLREHARQRYAGQPGYQAA